MPIKMTRAEAERVLMRMGDCIEWDEDYGFLLKAPLIDATLVAIKALREPPIIHARWFAPRDCYQWRCSHCRRKGGRVMSNYCPHCGAKMDAEELEDV